MPPHFDVQMCCREIAFRMGRIAARAPNMRTAHLRINTRGRHLDDLSKYFSL